jgi:MoaA/NifB/PqqE/SkfB family radical SAM enzyme
MKGINIIVTYKCNIRCSSCKYNCGPHRKGMMDIKDFKSKIEKAYMDGYNNYIIIEGGEPLLESAIIFKYLKSILIINSDKYIITNGFWGNADIYMDILGDLKKVGLKGIIFEYDFFHSIFINMNVLREAILMCMKSGLEVMFKADFISGDIKNEIDIRTFDYIKNIKREFSNSKFIFNDLNKNTKIFGRSYLKEERVIYYKS